MFHGDTAGQQEARTAMPEIMKADFAETVPFQQPWKLRCDIVRLEPIPNIIYANIFKEFSVIGASTYAFPHLLLKECQVKNWTPPL